jgi:hypothetical protein
VITVPRMMKAAGAQRNHRKVVRSQAYQHLILNPITNLASMQGTFPRTVITEGLTRVKDCGQRGRALEAAEDGAEGLFPHHALPVLQRVRVDRMPAHARDIPGIPLLQNNKNISPLTSRGAMRGFSSGWTAISTLADYPAGFAEEMGHHTPSSF